MSIVVWSFNTYLFASIGLSEPAQFLGAAPGNAALVLIGALVGLLFDTRKNLRDEVSERKKTQAELQTLTNSLEKQVKARTRELTKSNRLLRESYERTLEGWARALDLRDQETEGHTQRVTRLTVELARRLNVPEEDIVNIRRGALLHDIGKMGIPDAILLKAGPLDEEEWKVMRRHPKLAHEMLSPISFLEPALNIPFCHHERWDGSGYPRGLKGEQTGGCAHLCCGGRLGCIDFRPPLPCGVAERESNGVCSEKCG